MIDDVHGHNSRIHIPENVSEVAILRFSVQIPTLQWLLKDTEDEGISQKCLRSETMKKLSAKLANCGLT
ncbi:hypothetical protein I79_026155 [Cricetulus griseus]|uniref:Uncharacterized protein n=1 Tax=Cricetulus griseus TaxID=10029 RepID=G3IQ62_CRIGR|nr:hypothetical protein I79_026155 [Cricetulus griseus]